jgi:ribulose-5-phosphate 4-epimerase/fuculose-1-phosphate aldolase
MKIKNPAHIEGLMPKRATIEEEKKHRKMMLAASFRIFGKFGFSEGVAGHITVRDPEFPETFWVNPFGVSFNQIKVSDLIRVDHHGKIVEGKHTFLNQAAFAIHSRLHHAHPDVIAAAHAHSIYGKTWSAMGKLLDPLTQDACAFYGDHAIYDYNGVVMETSEGDRIAEALGYNKAAILKNHGLLTVGNSVEEAVWWFISMERCCQSQILAESMTNLKPLPISHEVALKTRDFEVGFPVAGWFSFQPLLQDVMTAGLNFME